MQTACIEVCPRGARRLGDTKKLHDEVSEIVARSHVHVLKPELLTDPNCVYIGLSREVR
jgi:Fe-S-cluster-containing dehydrogenase component